MEHQVKREPSFWINPNFRLNSPHFHFSWFTADMNILRQEAMVTSVERKVYQTNTQCVVCMTNPDHSSFDIVYACNTNIKNMRLQKWLRELIRDEITARAKIVLPNRLGELERKHNLFGNSVMVKKLRGNIMGCCSVYLLSSFLYKLGHFGKLSFGKKCLLSVVPLYNISSCSS